MVYLNEHWDDKGSGMRNLTSKILKTFLLAVFFAYSVFCFCPKAAAAESSYPSCHRQSTSQKSNPNQDSCCHKSHAPGLTLESKVSKSFSLGINSLYSILPAVGAAGVFTENPHIFLASHPPDSSGNPLYILQSTLRI